CLAPRQSGGAMAALALVVALVALAALALAAPTAQAAPRTGARALHARYLSSVPAANAVVKAAPSTVTIHFAEPVDPAGSAVVIYDAKGHVVSQAAHVETNDLTTMRVAMTSTDSEVYLVYWHTVSATDGYPDVGAFNFFVSASGASELAPTGVTATPATTPASAPGAPIWLAALIAVVALLVGLAGGAEWARRRASAGAR
ncbi:MAG: copper resistance CopC family protein, partial [Ktedonobacterales bacterium]